MCAALNGVNVSMVSVITDRTVREEVTEDKKFDLSSKIDTGQETTVDRLHSQDGQERVHGEANRIGNI